jgi:hypothetical protein
MFVAGEHYVRPRLVKDFPQRLNRGYAAMYFPGAEAGVMHVGQRAPLVGVGSEVGLEPPNLRRRTVTAVGFVANVAVERDDVPRA